MSAVPKVSETYARHLFRATTKRCLYLNEKKKVSCREKTIYLGGFCQKKVSAKNPFRPRVKNQFVKKYYIFICFERSQNNYTMNQFII